MKFTTNREALLKTLQLVTGVVERRQTLPVLSNLLVGTSDAGALSIRGTDLEVELIADIMSVEVQQAGEATIPARKLADIWRSLPDGAEVSVALEGDRAIVRSGRSRFTLATIPASEFPLTDGGPGDTEVRLKREDLKRLLRRVSFSMAQQDVRYFLNGMLLEITSQHVRAVATDGHRLAMSTMDQGVDDVELVQSIVPRKGVLELSRLLDGEEDEVVLVVGDNYLRATLGCYTLTTKLVDGKFPDYEKVIPGDISRTVVGGRETLRQAFQRTAILSNEKYRGVRMSVDGEKLTIKANNPEQEEAEEVVSVSYDGEPMEIGFNVSYLQDVLGVLTTDEVRLGVSDANNSALIEAGGGENSLYVIMPMRL
ncbi:MAG: DNA polymerase III subunit beta [Pseudomonadales bacterium]|jgi:DNA polymerase-3 subunit beta|nr:DNA polymerase III subunit beta [Pseudomonadales bacterium]MDP6471427.1 DNA polymerase III subunit beta [Pseudomonadales bacterium]MDP6828596.1 DNA polymerase III subunit beta [Pseudomonadales bacterium]MDP6973221.1 DNA polymerase III subunit beta [Pseudomonadales bacterium]